MKPRKQSHRAWRIVVAGLAALIASTASAQRCAVKPASIPLGQTVRLRCEVPAATARLNGRTVRLFKQESGDWQGLMPVAVADAPGTYSIEFLAEDGTALASVSLDVYKRQCPFCNSSANNLSRNSR